MAHLRSKKVRPTGIFFRLRFCFKLTPFDRKNPPCHIHGYFPVLKSGAITQAMMTYLRAKEVRHTRNCVTMRFLSPLLITSIPPRHMYVYFRVVRVI